MQREDDIEGISATFKSGLISFFMGELWHWLVGNPGRKSNLKCKSMGRCSISSIYSVQQKSPRFQSWGDNETVWCTAGGRLLAICHKLPDVQKIHEINLTVPLNSTQKNVWVHDADFGNGNEPGTPDCESAMKILFFLPAQQKKVGN